MSGSTPVLRVLFLPGAPCSWLQLRCRVHAKVLMVARVHACKPVYMSAWSSCFLRLGDQYVTKSKLGGAKSRPGCFPKVPGEGSESECCMTP